MAAAKKPAPKKSAPAKKSAPKAKAKAKAKPKAKAAEVKDVKGEKEGKGDKGEKVEKEITPAKAAPAVKEAPAKPAPLEKAEKVEKEESSPAPAQETAPASDPSEATGTAGKTITMKPPIVVKELAAELGLKPFQVVHELMEMNVFATLNQTIDEETARLVCERKGVQFELERREKGGGFHKKEEVIEEPPTPVAEEKVDTKDLEPRPPVITFMGHVDHGKTSLLDYYRKSRVTAGEAGGITQHIGAYQVERNGQTITFLDTPGHAAFTAMRARGANVTDIAIIVVAADDGLMPQTREAIQHAQAAKVTIMIAINKCDLATANPDKVKTQLQEIDLTPEEWGGETVCCEVSATKGTGMDQLLELMLLQAEMMELKADPNAIGHGSIIESQIEPGRGPNATIIVQHGTLKRGDAFICGRFFGKVKALIDDHGKQIKTAGPSTPVKVLGFNGAPSPGEEFSVMKNERDARRLGEERSEEKRLEDLGADKPVTLESLFDTIEDGQKKTLNLIVKADVQGSIEAIVDSLKKIPTDKVEVNFVLTGVGPVTENDVLLAKASSAVVIGFSTKVDNAANAASKKEEVQIKVFSIIYELIDQVKESMQGLLDPEVRESKIGEAIVKKVFKLSKFPVAGCVVESGRLVRSARARVTRRRQTVYDGGFATLKRFQDEASEVRAGMECGVRLGKFDDYEEGDTIECYELEKVAQKLE
ncbi:MAG: translation initiation factor IF-2 [Verrucomicrobiota bacterium]